jgi:hypothetical protein
MMLLSLNFMGCGVYTDSSTHEVSVIGDNNGVISDGNNTTVDDNNTVDNNNTVEVKDPIFDTNEAEYDDGACSSANTTANPLQNHAGDERETTDSVNGMKVLSL